MSTAIINFGKMTIMDRIIKLVESLNRPGTEEVVKYLKSSNFNTVHGGGSHHKYRGGLIDHSLEVYENMKEKTKKKSISPESVIICSIFHDLGKTITQSKHWVKSIEILDRCGFELTEEERQAILNHHEVLIEDIVMPKNLGTYLKKSDMLSTGEYKAANPKKSRSCKQNAFNTLLTMWSKLK